MINFKEGQRVRCVKDDIFDEYYKLPKRNRWKVGDEFTIKKVEVQPYGTFLHDGRGNDLNADRAITVDDKSFWDKINLLKIIKYKK